MFQQRLARWQEVKKTHPKAEEPQPLSVVSELAAETVGFSITLSGSHDTLRVKLFCGRKPHATNGQWDAAAGTVAWSKELSSRRPLPVVCFAAWTEPDEAFQRARFGRVLLADVPLMQYVTWYRALRSDERTEWDRFVAGLAPGPKLAADVKAFRFSTDPKVDPAKTETKASLADTPRELILDGLKAKGDVMPKDAT